MADHQEISLQFRQVVRIGAKISVAVTVATLAVACGKPSEEPDGGGSLASVPAKSASEAPAFEGPYSAEFAEAYGESASDFVRGVLADGQITDSEYAEMKTQFASCLADQGITLQAMSPGEGVRTSVAPNGLDTDTIVSECSVSTGENSIGPLYTFVRRNPGNLDEGEIMATCLVRAGVVPENYSADDFATDNNGRFGNIQALPTGTQEALVSCSSDPLATLEDGD